MTQFPLKTDCFVSSITLLALKKLGLESLSWDPEILRDALEASFDTFKMPQKLFDKLNCGYTLVGTDAFVSTIEGFLTSTAIMNNLVFEEDEIPYCTLEQCAWSVWEYINLIGDMENGRPTDIFSSDIITYIQEVGKVNGISTFPEWLSFASYTMPDVSADVTLFELYQARQHEYISNILASVSNKQTKLINELSSLRELGLIAQ